MEETIRVFRAVKSQALDLGVKIALENHAGDMQAREISQLSRSRARNSWDRAWIPAIRSG